MTYRIENPFMCRGCRNHKPDTERWVCSHGERMDLCRPCGTKAQVCWCPEEFAPGWKGP